MRPTLKQIFKVTLNAFECSEAYYEEFRKTRKTLVVSIRQALCLIAQENGYSQNEIGRFIGLDHSTVLHNKRVAQDHYKYEKEYQKKIDKMRQKIEQLTEESMEYKISGWIARDKFEDTLSLFENKPIDCNGVWVSNARCFDLPKDAFPAITHKDKPQRIEMTLILSK